MKYKLLVMDIDDTLVNNGCGVSKENMDAIDRARKAGVYVTLATGRGYFASSHVWKQLGFSTYIINYGGALIMDSGTDEPFFVTELENRFVQEILKMADELRLHAHIYQGDCIIYEKAHEYATAYTSALNLPYRIDPDIRSKQWTDVPKVLIITEQERVGELLPMFEKHFEDRVYVSASSPGFIEFNQLGANKGTAVAMLADKLGIKREETVTIGDNTLDFEMIKWAGLGAVVANGNEKLKSIADVMTPSCQENGVAWLINNYILKEN